MLPEANNHTVPSLHRLRSSPPPVGLLASFTFQTADVQYTMVLGSTQPLTEMSTTDVS
jgi:hypothetical protein